MSRFFLAFTLASLLACRQSPEVKDDTTDSGTQIETGESAIPAVDADEDGYSSTEDCDDNNPDIHPDAAEICNEIDDNCDGLVDDDDPAIEASSQTEWYTDNDGDGYGNENDAYSACVAPSGTVAESASGFDCNDNDPAYHPGAAEWDCTDPNDYNCDGSVGYADEDGDGFAACEDCQDTMALVNPDAVEVCDGIDNNCDTWIDDNDPNLEGAPTWYGDADGDTYGGQQFTAEACEAPQGYVDNSDDCDDLDKNTHPDATEVCDESDNDCDGDIDEDVKSTWYADTDNDGYGDASNTTEACTVPPGYVWDSTDCNDSSATTNPASYEVCDGTDNNCDGVTDEASALDADTWYVDADSDGYGDSSSTETACDQPTGYVATDTDCNDADSSIYPGADEYCDSIDTDCDGTVDEDDALDADTWYADSDADGYGSSTSSITACDQSTGYVADDTDCDDTDANTYPSADEYCDNIDNNCDGTVDEDSALDASTWYADADSDSYGDSATSQSSCSQPTGYIADNTDCDDTSATAYPGASESCDDIDSDCDGSFVDTGDDECHSSATCTPDSSGVNHTCECDSGYTGDGTSTCEVDTFPSSNILTEANKSQLNAWAGTSNHGWTQCYQKSVHGDSASTFHSLCNGYSTTISVAQLDNGLVIGGYSGTYWSSSGYYSNSSNFLFSLTNGDQIMSGSGQHDTSHNYSQYNNSGYGPTFGGGHDWHVNSTMTGGYCNLGFSYGCQTGSYASSTCRNDFCGSFGSWTITEFEVYGY